MGDDVLELKLLGIPRLTWRGDACRTPSPMLLGILGYLALADAPKARSELLEVFWRDGKPANLRYALHKLREVPGANAWLATEGAMVRVEARTDVGALEAALREDRMEDALAALDGGDADTTLLAGLELADAPQFTRWIEHERSRVDALCHDALVQVVAWLAEREDAERGVPLARKLLERDPLDEAVHRAILRLEHGRGDTEAALAHFEACRTLLRDELGVEPMPETLALVAEIEGPSMGGREAAHLVRDPAELPHLPERLVGRAELVARAQRALASGGRMSLHGMGGAGKSALAATLAAESLEAGAGPVLWIGVGDGPPDDLFDAVARALDAHGEVRRAQDPASAVRDRIVAADVRLVVLDDVWSVYAMSKLLEAVPEGVPVAITSRLLLPGAARIEVGRLDRPASLELLALHAGSPEPADAATDALCELLADHAFAVRLAGISLAVEGIGAETLIERVRAAPHALRVPEDMAEAGRASIGALLETSLASLSEEGHEAFMAIGCLYAPSVTPDLLAAFVRRERESAEEALFELRTRGLAERWAEPGSDVVAYRLHDLAFSFARANHHHRPSTAERACLAFLERWHGAFDLVDAELANLLGAARALDAAGDDAGLVQAMRRMSVGDAYFRARGHTPASFALLRSARDAAERVGALDAAHAIAARIGDGYRELYGDFDAALEAYRDALELARAGGDGHREIVMMTLLGTTLSQRGDSEAETWLADAQELAEARDDDRALCQALEHRGCLAVREGRYEEARTWFAAGRGAVGRLEQSGETAPQEVARLRFFLLLNEGEAERGAGRLDAALERRREALALAEALANPVWRAYALHELGETSHALGDAAAAQDALSQALALYREQRVHSAVAGLTAFMEDAGYPVPPSADAQVDRPMDAAVSAYEGSPR